MRWRLDDGQIEVIDEAQAKVLRGKTPAQRVAMVGQCNRTMRLLIQARLQARHPDWTDEQLAAGVARRMRGGTDWPLEPQP
ncbi:MAG: hypothetical protein NT031_09225 [Planctomycetota bacterium]|nr:hypothetical protein [Planctomycetota bacterium]